MDVEDYIVLFLAIWTLTSTLTAKTVDVFLTLTLIGLLITLEVGSLFLSKEQKESLKPLIELLLVIFALIVMKKVYDVLAG
ncbi:hypothetical protein [Pyrococcus yayanosii]|uniref:Uncharacterized protein n=1 Tax=Pyrococcus yayanosii (strain CH1 / JCM 16557) TaxID=529709 RepID=F8AHZ9_PYRYC|nr:hypothetical protein [Pyrococcus yayanosii]AEH25456.1 hypothetical protein PYCH_17990 [Pyrococcus yayanosii CH1]